MKKFTCYLLIVPAMAVLNSCGHDTMEDVDLCANPPTITLKTIATVTGKSTGSIEANATGGATPLTFSIDGGAFQSGATFSNLAAGSYTVTVKDANNCTGSAVATVSEVEEVSYSQDIKPIIDTDCLRSGCHGDKAGIPDWGDYQTVKSEAGLIKQRTSEKSMPPPDSGVTLTNDQIKLIADWVDQGAPEN